MAMMIREDSYVEVEWNYATMTPIIQCVMRDGPTMTLLFFAIA